MRFESPTTIAQALDLLSDPAARCLAGGQSLGAMMNADLVEPEMLVSLRRVEGLAGVEVLADGTLRLGAMTTYRAVASLPVTDGNTQLIVGAVPLIAHPAIRNQGTVGGSICHADPAGDFPTLVTCVDASIRIARPGGVREVPAGEFFLDYFETSLEAGEMVIAIDVPRAPAGAAAHYEKFMLTEGDFAVASVAAVVGWKGGVCHHARVTIGACAAAPVHLAEADALLVGSMLDDATLDRAAGLLAAACDPMDDFRASRAYRLKLIPRLLRRAVLQARARAEQGHE
jgi:aerobic carbon-monoxide dehydrogenase medium subunit